MQMRTGVNAIATMACLLACNCFLFAPPDDDMGEPSPPAQRGDDAGIAIDPDCELTEALTLEIGEGDDDFVALEDGEPPELYSQGGFQGGPSSSHYYVSLRIGNVDTVRYRILEVELDSYHAGECPDDGEPCDWSEWGRTRVFGDDEPLILEDDQFVVSGVFMPHSEHVATQVLVRDSCGREAWAQRRW